jgi:hypothetical protein
MSQLVSSAPTISAVDRAMVRPEPSCPAAITSFWQPCTALIYGSDLQLAGLGPHLKLMLLQVSRARKCVARVGMYTHACSMIAYATASSSTSPLSSPLCRELPTGMRFQLVACYGLHSHNRRKCRGSLTANNICSSTSRLQGAEDSLAVPHVICGMMERNEKESTGNDMHSVCYLTE